MPQTGERARIVVLCSTPDDRPPGMDAVEQRADVTYVDTAGLGDAVQGAHGLFLWDFFSSAVRDVWDRADSLEWIHVAAAGVDKLLFDELNESDVVVTNARGVFDRPIAEFVLMALLARAKDLRTSYRLQDERTWQHRETLTLAGTTALVVGTGAIGREIARVLRAVGVEVQGVGRTARSGDADFGTVVESSRLAEHAGWADHLVVVAPLTPATRGLVDREVLAAMKPTAHLVNVGRGASVVEDDLLQALRDGSIAAATLDVFETEPLPDDSPLWTAPGLTVTPHMSGDTVGWQQTLADQFVDNATRWLDGEPVVNVVDKRLGYVPSSSPTGADGR